MTRLTILLLVVLSTVYSFKSYSQETISQEEILLIKEKQFTVTEIDSLMPAILTLFNESSYEKVIEVVPHLLDNAKRLKAPLTTSRLRSILGNAFIQVDDIQGAEDLFNNAIEENKKANDTFNLARNLTNLGNTFFEEDPDKAITYFEEALAISPEIENSILVDFISNNNLAELYVIKKQPNEAQYYLDQAKELLMKGDFNGRKNNFEGTVYHVQSSIYLLQNRPIEAIEAINYSMEVAGDEQDDNYKIDNYKNLMKAYESLGNYEQVNSIRKTYDVLVEKRYEANKIKQQKNATSRFNLNKFKQELRASKLENELALQKAGENKLFLKTSLAIAAILLLFIGTLLHGRKKRKRLLDNLKSKNKQYLQAKKKSQKLARSNTKFLSTVSHELRTPLYGIIGLSSVFLEDPALKNHTEDLKSLKFSADYLLALVNDILSLNKFDSKEGERIQKTNFRLHKLLPHIVQTLEFINKKNNNTTNVIIDPNIPDTLLGDKTKISQVLMNLSSNASKFTEDGTITIKATLQEKNKDVNTILFSIADTGQGIAKEEQAKIFTEFAQVGAMSNHQGTGLGLPIVKKILHILGSKLSLVSRPNKGSTFSFTIDLETGSDSYLEVQSDISSYERLKGKKVLIVDDNSINQLVTKKVLEQYGIKNESASNGQQAVSAVKNNAYDFILMDINMPIMNGIDASIVIRKFDSITPIIALTATSYKEGDKELTKHGINNSILKPYKTEILLDMLLMYSST
ncbi:ATP-binding protein [Dokdonia sp. R86516]|uniref:tetratricopeptide repeat-containing hybrid sensor histidine kinase/response regulator n=1 Tax=Dokdonia sp. R86516 TaxID=3093856 RepID=UPI0037C69B10